MLRLNQQMLESFMLMFSRTLQERKMQEEKQIEQNKS